MALKMTIGGVPRSMFVNSLNVADRLGQAPTASIDIREVVPTTLVTVGEEVVIYDDAVTETIRQSVPSPNPPGLRYEPSNEGSIEAVVPHQTRASGTIEGIFANLYNLPDLRLLGVVADMFIFGGYVMDGWASQWVQLGLYFKVSDGNYYYAARFYTGTYGVNHTFIISTTKVELDTSVRMSVTWTTTTNTALEIFINGTSEGTATATGAMTRTTPTDPDTIHLSGKGANYGIGQYFADIRIWDDVRTPTEISTNKFTRLTGADLTDANLEAYWMCDEMTGTTCNDSGPNNNDATLLDDGDGFLIWRVAPDPWLPNSGPTCTDATVPLRYFGGRVNSANYVISEIDATTGKMLIIQHIGLIGYAEACNRKIVDENFMSTHDGKYYCNYLGLHLLDPEGIGYGCIPNGSATFAVPDWTAATCKKALDDIYTATGWIWYIDPYKELRYHAQGYKTAPFNIADADSPSYYLANSMTVDLDKQDYFNQILARIALQVAGVTNTYLIRISNTAEIVARATAEGTSGVYTHWVDITNAASLDQGIALAQGLLTNGSTMGKIVNYTTRTGGLRPGQTQSIENADLGVSGTFLIESVEVTQNYPDLYYKVTASSWKRYKNSSLQNTLTSALNAVRNWTQSLTSYNDVPYVPTY